VAGSPSANGLPSPPPTVLSSLRGWGRPGKADVTQILAMAGFYTMFFLLTLYMQDVLHYYAIHAGLCHLR
jgi:hypothetical protein